VKPSFKLSWEPLICQELTEFAPAIRMGIVRKVLLGLENRAGCIFSLLLNAFEWCLRFKFETGWEP
jgi:hypothetical protein